MSVDYYDRKGRPLTCLQWAELIERNPDGYKFVGQDQIGPYRVSTIWLGLDHSFGGGPPMIFETMIFTGKYSDGGYIQYQERYSTEEQAIAGHAAAIIHARALRKHRGG